MIYFLKKLHEYYDKLIAANELYFCDLIENDRMLRKTLNFDEIDYEEYDKIYDDISNFYDDLINKIKFQNIQKIN